MEKLRVGKRCGWSEGCEGYGGVRRERRVVGGCAGAWSRVVGRGMRRPGKAERGGCWKIASEQAMCGSRWTHRGVGDRRSGGVGEW